MPDQVQLSPEKKAAIARFKGEEIGPDPVKTPAEIAAEKEEADKVLAQEQEKERLRLEEEEDKNKNQPPVVIAEPTDEQLLEAISKRSGRKISSFDELKPKPEEIDKEKLAEKREADKLSFGLQKGLFNKKQFENFIADSKDPISLVYAAELQEAKKEDPAWDEDKEREFKEEFDEKFGLNLDQSSSKFKRGQKQLTIIADTILKSTYAPIYNLESEYGRHESETNQQAANKQKILETAPVYKKEVDEIVTGLASVDFPFGTDEKYTVPVPQEMRDSIKEILLDKDFVTSQILNGYKKEEIAQIATNMVITQNYPALAHEAAKLYRAKHEKGVRGIPEGGKIENQADPYENLTEAQKTALKFFKPEVKTTAN
jgi:hypothetical protein